MIFLKILSILVTAGAGLLQIGLEHWWDDKSTGTYNIIRTILILLIIIGMFSTAVLVIYDDQQSELQIKTLISLNETAERSTKEAEQREIKAVEERERIQKELEKIQIQIKPILALAIEKYPTLDTDVAIKKLSEDIENLQKQQVELKKKAEPRKLSIEQKEKIISRLNSFPERQKIYIFASILDTESLSYAEDIEDVFLTAGFEVYFPKKIQRDAVLSINKTGLHMAVKDPYKPLPLAVKIQRSFIESGIIMPAIKSGEAEFNDNRIEILVGQK